MGQRCNLSPSPYQTAANRPPRRVVTIDPGRTDLLDLSIARLCRLIRLRETGEFFRYVCSDHSGQSNLGMRETCGQFVGHTVCSGEFRRFAGRFAMEECRVELAAIFKAGLKPILGACASEEFHKRV